MADLRDMTLDERFRLLTLAQTARSGSYSPYSKFRVGAALLLSDGTFVTGANIENASYGGAICAERTALVKAVSEGKKRFVALAVAADIDEPCSPCGICRQFIREFCSLDMPILLIPSSHVPSDPSGLTSKAVIETTLGHLLPMSFGPDDLVKPRPGSL
ncbi:MAG: hypothetical protein CYPHOPRED_003926 [Cyphobasidiales sp. Tagirdzhanova-0007]|nr:MAG: hypothetical protein CYPHOPRED_003926 [Cyphobasidiales sp. Tagirdzhanova-0007]